MTTIEITYGSETVRLEADLSEATAPLVVDGESTQYQTADARHRTDVAVLLAAGIVWPEAEWPRAPRYGDGEIVSTEAWDELAYETVEDVV